MKKLLLAVFVILGGFVLALPVLAAEEAEVKGQKLEVYNAITFEKEGDITLAEEYDRLSFQIADLGNDGQDEIIVGAGAGDLPEVRVLRSDGSEIYRFMAYGEGYRGGVVVAVSDVNNDGTQDIVTGTRAGGGPHIRVFTSDGTLISHWFAFDGAYRGGVNIAVGNVTDGFGGDEIIVSKAEGEPALLRIFSFDGQMISEWYPFDEKFYGGLNMDISPDGQIIVARAFGKSPMVRVFNRFGGLENEFMAYYDDFPGGVHAQAIINPNGGWDVFTVPGFSGGPHIRNFSSEGRALSPGFLAFDGEYKGGIVIDAGDIDGDGEMEIVVAKESKLEGPTDTVKSIVVDISEQKMRTYYKGELKEEYWISSGTWSHPTPVGKFSIFRKREKTDMTWTYGPDHPDNYDLKDVPHVLSFLGPYTIHAAYWHNNFGHRMSHGCVNMSIPDAEEIYSWADIGTTVVIK